jgi:Protein of unknown function (DUF1353)
VISTVVASDATGFDRDLAIRAVTATTWVLTEPLTWTGPLGDTFTVPAGFVTDFATVPRFLHWLVLPYGAYTRAAVLHDWLIETRINHPDPALRVSSRDTDGIFRRVLAELGVSWGKRWMMWAAVRAAALFNPRRARGREFRRDAAKVLAIALGALPITIWGVAGVLISLGLAKVLRALHA